MQGFLKCSKPEEPGVESLVVTLQIEKNRFSVRDVEYYHATEKIL